MIATHRPVQGENIGPETTPGEIAATRTSSRSGGRIVGLDALRGLAALAVVVYHYTLRYDAHYGYKGPVAFRFGLGFYGVYLFFIISGFVIFMTVEKTKRPIDFLISRFARLYPAYWVALGCTFLALAIFPEPIAPLSLGQLSRRALVNASMIQGWLGVGSIDGAYWTLQIEMTFYAIMFVLLCAGRVNWAIGVLLGLVSLGVVQEVFSARLEHPWLVRARGILALDYIHVLTIGVLLYEIRLRPRRHHFFLIAILMFVPFSQHGRYQDHAVTFAMTVALATIVYLATTGRLPWLENRSLVFLGTISYTLYLIHTQIGWIMISQLDRAGMNHDLSIATTLGSVVVMATALSFLVERPAMKAIKRRAARSVSSGQKLAVGS